MALLTSITFRRFFATTFSLWLRLTYAQTGYVYRLDTEYAGANFFNGWDFFTGGDPTYGLVTYLNQPSAQAAGMVNTSATTPTYIGVDYTNIIHNFGNENYGAGRPSVRISSQKRFTHGLFIGDFAHMPGGICGTWPAFWTLGDNWPYNGEIDIVEGVNQLTQNAMSLHASPDCSIAGDARTETGVLQATNCAYYVQYGGNGVGCGVADKRPTSYGAAFNQIGGGVYAMQWTSDYIRVWFFERNNIPADITNLTPNPAGWGLPAGNLQGSCVIDQKFQGHKIIFDNTFCGEYAGAASVWNSTLNSCALSTGYPTCNGFVAANPSAFQNSYWSINSVRVYQLQANGTSSTETPYTASLQPTNTIASSTTSSAPTPIPSGSYCPTYNFTTIQTGSLKFEIECGYNPGGSDIGPPYSGYSAQTFEACVAGCVFWNTHNGTNSCVMVTFNIKGKNCYYKKTVSGVTTDSNYNGARLIYYGYPQITDNPNVATITASSTYVSTPVTPQTYSNPIGTSATLSLTSAVGASSLVGIGMGGGHSSMTDSGLLSSTQSSPISSSALTTSTPASSQASSTSISPKQVNSITASSFVASSSIVKSSIGPSISATGVVSSSPAPSSNIASSSPTTSRVLSNGLLTTSSTLSTPGTTQNPTIYPPSSGNPPVFSPSTSTIQSPLMSMTTPSSSSASTSSAPPSINISPSSSTRVPTSTPLSSADSPQTTPPMIPWSTSTFSSSQTPVSSSTTPPTVPPTSNIASSVIFGVTTSSPASSAPTLAGQPVMVDGFAYAGCLGLSPGSTDFRIVEISDHMSIETCVTDCFDSAYIGISGISCYCGDSVDATQDLQTYPESLCNTPCPGNPAQVCGGQISGVGSLERRQAASGEVILLTIYENEEFIGAGGSIPSSSAPPASSFKPSILSTPSPTVIPRPSSTPYKPPTSSISGPGAVLINSAPGAASLGFSSSFLGQVPLSLAPPLASAGMTSPGMTPTGLPFLVSTLYVDVCPTGVTELATTITVVHCGCTENVDITGATVLAPPPAVPMTTTVKECACGENGAPSSTTLTVPCSSAIAEASSSVVACISSWSALPGGIIPTPIPWQSEAIAAVAGAAPLQAPASAIPANSAEGGALESSSPVAQAPPRILGHNTVHATMTLPPSGTQTITLQSNGYNASAELKRPATLLPSHSKITATQAQITKSEGTPSLVLCLSTLVAIWCAIFTLKTA